MVIDNDIDSSASHELATKLAQKINCGQLIPGQKLGSLRKISSEYNVSLATVRHCFSLLGAEGLIISKHGSGTFVNPALKLSGTKLLGLITSYTRGNIENYYEPLFEIAAERRIVPMIAAIQNGLHWERGVEDLLIRKPDAVFVDVEARNIPLKRLNKLLGDTPIRYCNRWEWHPDLPTNAVLTDYATAYANGLNFLKEKGHKHILLIDHSKTLEPFLDQQFSCATIKSGFSFGDNIFRISYEDIIDNPSRIKKIIQSKKITAIFGTSDYLVHRFCEEFPEALSLEKLGFYNLHHSKNIYREFNSFNIDFGSIWSMAIDTINENFVDAKYYVPKLVINEPAEMPSSVL